MSETFDIKIENIVAFVTLGVKVPLNRLLDKVDAEYGPEQFPGLVYRTDDPKSASLIFSNGKVVCTGTRSMDDAKKALITVVKKIKSVGIPVPSTFDIHIDDIVASTKLETDLKLDELKFSMEDTEYDPEKFPGLIHKLSEPNATFLIFSSGRIVCTGTHNIKDVKTALIKLKKNLRSVGIKLR